ncbi:MAG: endolytic transglycosylase MltG [Candidatus Uhrbacteria bacterium]|nr:endolytic transglycosylase MltG [Candidatus Uhrbacteria bacterium]
MIKKVFRWLILIFLLLCLGAVFIVGSITFQSYRFWIQGPAEDAEMQIFTVENGQGLQSIAASLEEDRFIKSAFWFRFYTILDSSSKSLQAGEFELSKGMSYASIVDVLIDAESEEISITIPEGYTITQIGDTVVNSFDITQAEWAEATGIESVFESHDFIVSAQKPDDVDLEGYLFPDTYRFYVGATAEDIVGTLIDTMHKKINDAGIVVPEGKTMHEVLTLASILEREVRSAEDKALVADLFLRRLEIGMALQADSTVNYITGNDTPSITLTDRDIDSPYNTYLYSDLPPGPISNPGIDSIYSVVNPFANDYWFFLTTPEGEAIYSVTHDEHVANKNLYLR